MSSETTRTFMSRRRFLQWSAMGSGILVLAACEAAAPAAPAAPAAEEAEPTPEPTVAEEPAAAAEPVADVEVMVSDVREYVLESDEWAGGFGSVTFTLHEGAYNGEPVYYIRTDASEQAFAEEVGLVFVPLLNAAAGMEEGEINTFYLFDDERPLVVTKIPGDENYTSLGKIMRVTVGDAASELNSAEAVQAAIDAGEVEAEDSGIFVNYPFIAWPGGELAVDADLAETLGGGQLFAAPDTENMEVTMKLHQCYPSSRYILTDSGMMAPMMNVVDAPVTNRLKELGGTDEIWVFANGIPGPGVMGFQPAIFDNKAGEPAWSPMWDHFTVRWVDEANARVLTSSDEIRALVDSGELELFNGVPDSHPTGFVVNCPAPILAPNTFQDTVA